METIKDDYDLINSKAIAEHCRKIKHELNTEELAVLVYRNSDISIKEKIEKYNDLIQNYPDMEVIERNNCRHYDSVQTLIQKEVERLDSVNKVLIQEEPDCIWTWTEYNKSIDDYNHGSDINNTFKTYTEAINDVQRYINEYDDTYAFILRKTYFDRDKNPIVAKYNVKNKKIILNNLYEENDMDTDLDQIFLYLPTPFKKGDLLVQKNKILRNIWDDDTIFVLDYMYTWDKNLKDRLKRGCCDSSDMLAYGYYLRGTESLEVTLDHKWDYDSFEYYNGELKGRNRLLKAISSLLKGEISLELFLFAYNLIRKDNELNKIDWYTDEGKKLAGLLSIEQ